MAKSIQSALTIILFAIFLTPIAILANPGGNGNNGNHGNGNNGNHGNGNNGNHYGHGNNGNGGYNPGYQTEPIGAGHYNTQPINSNSGGSNFYNSGSGYGGPSSVPIDGGLSLLALAGVAYTARKARKLPSKGSTNNIEQSETK